MTEMKGPYKTCEFKCSDMTSAPGVMSEHTGSAICWASGRTTEEAYQNAQNIANALNKMEKQS